MEKEASKAEPIKSPDSAFGNLECVTPDNRETEIAYHTSTDKTTSMPDAKCIDDVDYSFEKKSVTPTSVEKLQSEFEEAMRMKKEGKAIDGDKLFSDAYEIAKILHESSKLEHALEYYGHALRVKNKIIATEHKRTKIVYANILFSVGEIHMMSETDERAKCIQAFDFCLDLRRHCFGSSHPAVADVLYKLAAVYFSMGEKEYSLNLLVETVSILLSANGAAKMLGEVWYTISKVQQSLGRYEDAKSSYYKASSFLVIGKDV